MRRTARPGVQQHYIKTREILDDVLCIRSASSPTRRAYLAVLEVPVLNFLLKSEEEQDALVARYRALLKSLTFSLQIILRHQRVDLRPYVDTMRAHAASTHDESLGQDWAWSELSQNVEELLAQLSSRRTLMERHCYLVIPAPDLTGTEARLRFLRKRLRIEREALVARALQELEARVEMIQQQLAALGLHATRVRGFVLAQLYESCLRPEHALMYPLRREHLAAVERVPDVGRAPSLVRFEHIRALRPGGTATPTVSAAGESTQSVPPPEDKQAPSSHKLGRAWLLPRKQHHDAARPSLPPPDLLRLADVLAPGSIEEYRDALCVDGEWVRGIAVAAFPREVTNGAWLAPLMMHDDMLEIVFHVHPQPQVRVLRQLKQRRAGYTATRVFNRRQGRLDDPEMEVAHNDVTRLIGLLASGEERLFEVSLLLLVRAGSRAELDERTDRMKAILQTVFMDAVCHATTFEHAAAFRSFLPEGRDELGRTILLDSTSLATTFPFIGNAFMMAGGAFLGVTGTGDLVLLNPWDASLENPHCFIGGVTGSGKSYLGKLWLIRSLLIRGLEGERCAVIDPDGEYTTLAHAMGGSVMRLAPGSVHHLNPFDLVPPGCVLSTYLEEVKGIDRLAEKILDLQSLLTLMLVNRDQELGMDEKALLDAALYETYRRVGITADPRTHTRTPPLLRDLYEVLRSGVCGADTAGLTLRLSRYVKGSLAGIFAKQTNVPLNSHLLVWDIRDMRGDLRPIGIFLIADATWTQAFYQHGVRRCLSIDEAASIVEHPAGGRFLASLSRRARKRFLRIVTMTQNPERFVEDEFGGIVAANAAIKILKLQDRTSVLAVAHRFGLTQNEAQRLRAFGTHEALLLAGDRRVLLSIHASAQEHRLITTNPVELAPNEDHRVSSFPTGWPQGVQAESSEIEESGDSDYTFLFSRERPTNHLDKRETQPDARLDSSSTYDPDYGFFPTEEEWEGFGQ